MRSRYRELGLNIFSLKDNLSRHPKKPPMVEEKGDHREGDHFKMFLEESLM
jgi:hypothetical protein